MRAALPRQRSAAPDGTDLEQSLLF